MNHLVHAMANMTSTAMSSMMNMTGMNHTGMGMDHTGMGANHTGMGMNHTGMGMDHTGMGMDHTGMGANHTGMGMNHTGMGMDHTGMGMDHTGMGMDHTGMGMDHTGGDHSSHLGVDHMMKMYFNFDLPIYVLFIGWKITTQGQLAGSCVGIFILSVIFEGFKAFREYLYKRMRISLMKRAVRCVNGGDDGVKVKSREPGTLKKMFNEWHILQSALQILITSVGMFLMLIFMTFNVWLALSVSLGSGFGYFLFFWNKKSATCFDNADHCI